MQILRSYPYSQTGGLEKDWGMRKILNKWKKVGKSRILLLFCAKIKFCDIIYKNTDKEGVIWLP